MAALQQMFPPGGNFPQLRTLILSWTKAHYSHVGPFITGAELAGMLSACPRLHSLDIIGALESGGICSLLKLPQTCRELCVGGAAFGDNAVATVKELTQLPSLQWVSSPHLTDAGMYQLTALIGLQELLLRDDDGLSETLVMKADEMEGEIHLQTTEHAGCGGCFQIYCLPASFIDDLLVLL
jgi:hypothetical protein